MLWLPHEELINNEWVMVKGMRDDGSPTPEEQIAYFRSQLNLFSKLSYGRNLKTAETMVELVPLEALLWLLDPPPSDLPNAPKCRLLPRDLHLVSEILLWLYLDSPKLDAQKESLISQLHLWESQPPPRTPEEREKYLDNSICSPESQVSSCDADEKSPWARNDDKYGVPVWLRRVPTPVAPAATSAPVAYASDAAGGIGRGSASLSTPSCQSGPASMREHSFERQATLVGGVTLGGEGVQTSAEPFDLSLEKDTLELDETQVALQQIRLLRIVESALSQPDVLVYNHFVPPEDASEEQQQAMSDQKERFRYNLSTLRMMRLMAADGMYLPGYMLPPLTAQDPANATRLSSVSHVSIASPAYHTGPPDALASTSTREVELMRMTPPDTPISGHVRVSEAVMHHDSDGAIVPGAGAGGARASERRKHHLDTISETIEPIRKLERMLLQVLQRSEPQEYIRTAAADYINSVRTNESEACVKVLKLLYTKTTEADVVLVDAKVELCKILQLLYDMYTDTRLSTVVSRYKKLYTEHVEKKMWEKRDGEGNLVVELYRETMPFDRPDKEYELPDFLLREYPGLKPNAAGESTYTYSEVFERLCYLDLKRLVYDSETLFESSMVRGNSSDAGACTIAGGLSERLMNLTLYDDARLRAEAFTLLQRQHSQRDELRSSLAKLRFIVDPEEKDTYEFLSENRSRFAMISATADTTAPVWSHYSNKSEDFVPYSLALCSELERAYANDAAGFVDLSDGKIRVYFAREGEMMAFKLDKRGEPIWTKALKGGARKPAGRKVRRSAPHPQLLAMLSDYQTGVTALCYRRFSDEVCPHSGRPYDRTDPDERVRHDKEMQRQLESAGHVRRWEPSKDMLEEGNQAMMVQEGWHKQVLRFLGCYGDGPMGKRVTAARARAYAEDPSQHIRLSLVAACFRLLYYICLDHPKNWESFSDSRTLNFLFLQLSDLAEVNEPGPSGELNGHRLNYWVAKLIEEIIEDNSDANTRLEASHIDRVVELLVLDRKRGYVEGRTQYLAILKAIVEDEVQPLYERQLQVVEALQKVPELAAMHQVAPEDVLLYYQSQDEATKDEYLTGTVTGLYATERANAEKRGITVDDDGLPDPTNVDCDLNYHLELVDLLGMCSKGRNKFTEKYSRELFDEKDVMAILCYQSADGSRVNTLFRSPFVRILHGVYFSAVADDAHANPAATRGPAMEPISSTMSAGEVSATQSFMMNYWPELVRLFRLFEEDMRRFSVLVRLEEREDVEERERDRKAREEKGRMASMQVDGDDDNEQQYNAARAVMAASSRAASSGGLAPSEAAGLSVRIDKEEEEVRQQERQEEERYLAAMRAKRAEEAERRGVRLDEVAEEDEDESSVSDAKWDLLENYIFFVVLPFLTDFYRSDEYPLRLDALTETSSPRLGEDSQRGVGSDAGGDAADLRQADALIQVSQQIARTARRMVKLGYVMGKEMLRDSLDTLLDKLLHKACSATTRVTKYCTCCVCHLTLPTLSTASLASSTHTSLSWQT